MALIDRLYGVTLVSYNHFNALVEKNEYADALKELEWLKKATYALKKSILSYEDEVSSIQKSKTFSSIEESEIHRMSIDLIKKIEEHVESLGYEISDYSEQETLDIKSPNDDSVSFEDDLEIDDFNIDDFLNKE